MNSLSHVAIIMDGNGRWAKKKNKPRKYGHLKGTENINNIINFCLKKRIPYLTLFAFGFDNWSRPKRETDYLFFLFRDFLDKNYRLLLEKNIKIKFIGETKKIPNNIISSIKKIQQDTENNLGLNLIIALNYASKIEITNAINKILIKQPKVKITEKIISQNLYTFKFPDPDILIRTGGHCRLSNFLLWQVAYTELFFIKKFWPDFTTKDLSKIINRYKFIKRNFGKI